MKKEMALTNRDLMILNLVNFFVAEENYNPIVVHGVDNEVWLENMNGDYKVVRIISHHIHNDEQLKLDNFKVDQVIKQLKSKTLSLKMDVLNIYTDIDDNVKLDDSDNTSVIINKISDLKNPTLLEVFPNIVEKTKHKEKGIDLFVKITDNINKVNMKKAELIEKLFSKKKPIITYAIMTICIVMFLLMYVFGNGSEDNITLLSFGANFDVLTKGGEYYRLLTCTFLHIGIIHLLCNMYALYIIGPQVENFYGKFKYLFIYLVSAISGSLLSLVFTHNTISAGASGAIFGLLGAIIYFGHHYRTYLSSVIKSQIIPIILLNLLLGFTLPGVDNAAHIGGLIGGMIAAMAMGVPDKSEKTEKINGWIILIIFLGFISYLGFVGI